MASLESPTQVIAETRSPNKDPRKGKPAYKRASAERIVAALRLHAAGLTQHAIAAELGCTQPAVSNLLAKYGRSTVKEARQICEATAADQALNVARNGRPADQIHVLKALSVLPQDVNPQQGLSITINGFALVGLGLQAGEAQQPILDVQALSPPLAQDIHSLSVDNTGAKANIMPLISTTRPEPVEADPGARSAGDPTRVGGG